MSVMQDAEVLEDILPTDASCEDLELDSSLSFLDDYVSAALQNGATPYLPKHMRKEEPKKRVEECSGTTPQLKFTPYQRQLPPRRPLVEHQVTSQAVVQPPAEITSSLGQGNRSQSATEGLSLRNGAELGSNPNYRHGLTPSAKPKKQVWGPEGYSARRQTQAGPMSSGRSDSSDSTSGAGSLSGSSGKLVEKRSSIPEPQALPEFPKVPEDSERRKLADALFQGIGTTRDSRGTPNIEKAGVQPKRKHGKQRHTRTAGLGTRPKQDNVKPHPADKMLLDLDDSGVGETSGSELVDAIVEPKYQNDTSKVFTKDDNVQENDISSMFQGLKASSSEPNKAETTQPLLQYQIAKESPSLSDKNEEHDILDLQQLVSTEINEPHPILDSEAPPLTTPVVDNKSSAAEIVSVTNIMPKELEAYPRSEIKDVCADLNIRLCAHAIYTPTSLDLILTLRNQSSSKVTDVQLMVEPPSNLFASLDQESEMGTVDNLIEISQSVQHILSLTFKSPALNMCVGGHLNYKDATLTVKRLFINHRITTRDLLRPLMLTTGEFEMAWGSVAYDKKQDLGQSSFRSVKDAVSVLEKECRFSLVEIRGNDAILAGSILNKDKILVHAKVSPTDKKLTVKSGSKLLNDSIIKELVPLCCR